MQTLASKAYGQTQHRIAGDRDIEYALFAQITEALENVSTNAVEGAAARVDAISRNLSLWTILATDLLSPGNALPADMKNRLLILAEFVRRESMKRLSDDGELNPLVEINRTVMSGLIPDRSHNPPEGAA